MKPTPRLLVRIVVGKIENRQRLEAILRDTPIRAETEGWNCVEWIKEVLEGVGRDDRALGTAVTEWQYVRDWAMWYIDEKHQAGRFDMYYDPEKAPTWDLLESKELIP
ncbi:hypothetical protein HRG_001201 [Hirsutella rhossiliensis]|uniref:Uncharacterized protein n=1 Tax=Hirsutella rhossiliensis TaxID=111463 RepID=A0A9P8N896_9HYPO|nr:uncharacterized protein HRG_01201 [Hirsutella rhossiliensis]KAH0968559.1 hypothetical protein HRG_01201 [Hirsutella rhossiliensis]